MRLSDLAALRGDREQEYLPKVEAIAETYKGIK